jgi:hypothetical protein
MVNGEGFSRNARHIEPSLVKISPRRNDKKIEIFLLIHSSYAGTTQIRYKGLSQPRKFLAPLVLMGTSIDFND